MCASARRMSIARSPGWLEAEEKHRALLKGYSNDIYTLIDQLHSALREGPLRACSKRCAGRAVQSSDAVVVIANGGVLRTASFGRARAHLLVRIRNVAHRRRCGSSPAPAMRRAILAQVSRSRPS